ncbi:hypothetical protein JTB14_013989 [Gonioctena quinquepunctata]|nr:hypothetical protein JTB14_013989 [Gonioctena quinquepunctata]
MHTSQVADFYHDSTSGNQMDVVVVRIMYLEKEEEEIDLIINNDADKTLESFCKWQQTINPKDIENPNHHDIAVLLTRYDICTDEGADCGLMGLAYVAAACTKEENCAICEDGGLVLGIVVAHEMGHVMGCSHDKEDESSCPAQDKDESFFVMAPYVHIHTTKWSTCSKGFITALFENNLGECLKDEPKASLYSYKNALPGTIYDAEAQCDIMYPGSTLCNIDEEKFCEMLLCKTTPETCMSNEEPPADGTKCGKNKWCFHKKCIEVGERPESVNGGWGSWSSWSSCSRTCGGGVSTSTRDCNSPIPQYGGRYCLGDRNKFKLCNKDLCPLDQPSFRDVQCEEQNEKQFNGLLHKWKPFFRKDEPCVLYCVNEQNSFAKLGPRVKDGTPCKAGTKNRCISGICRKIGCDFQLDSDAVEDICGICNGDGTQCKIIEEVYKDTGAHDYKKVATIPQGSRNIRIEELAPSVNTMAVSDKTEKVFYLNGDHHEYRDGDIKFGKVEGVYTHSEPGKETLIINGPISEDLIFFVVFYDAENVGYRYTYAEPSTDLTYTPHYHWELLDWTDCTAKCGGGSQEGKYECVENKAGKVSSTFCVGDDKPELITKSVMKWIVKPNGRLEHGANAMRARTGRVFDREKSNAYKNHRNRVLRTSSSTMKNAKGKSRLHMNFATPTKRARARHVDQIPDEMLEDVWVQINRNERKRSEVPSTENNASCKPMMMMNNKSNKTIKLNVGFKVKDVVPPQEIKVIKVPFKQSHSSVNLSDNAFETMGDSVGDKVDMEHAEIVVGKDAADILGEMKDTPEERAEKANKTKTKN